MNVIVANKYQAMLSELDIDIIKTMNGEFTVDELIDTFSNFFFNRMILDITAIRDYKNLSNIQKLSVNLDMNKVILVLDDSPESSSADYLSKLISLGIYNFSRNIETIKYLIANPNSYKDVAHIHQLNDAIPVAGVPGEDNTIGSRIIGVKNITEHAGATTLVYLMKKQLEKNYDVIAVEVNKRDFPLFNDTTLISTTSDQYAVLLLKHKDSSVILVDLNEASLEETCTDIIYLIEPSTIKLNKMVRRDRRVFEKLSTKKIVLNKSLLDNKDVLDFEYESKSQIFFNMPPIDDKKNDQPYVNSLLAKLGFGKQNVQTSGTTSNATPSNTFKL